ncbi:gamma-glutamyltransferase [soil metagenome]
MLAQKNAMTQIRHTLAMVSFTPDPTPFHHWQITKPAARSSRGIVTSQVRDATEAGVAILEAGGNAVDAAVGTAFALAVVEPWNSGLGGIGFALVHGASEPRAHSVHYGPVAPRRLSPADFELTGGQPTNHIFPWPGVKDDANAHGPLSFCLPPAVAGYGLMLERWGTMPLREILQPAIALARRGATLDWYTTLMLAESAPILRRYAASSQMFLRDGLPPTAPTQGTPGFLPLGAMASTLEQLALAGWRDFYVGAVAERVIADIRDLGGVIDAEELATYRPEVREPLSVPWRCSVVQLSSGLTAGPTLADVFARLKKSHPQADPAPTPSWYADVGTAMKDAYRERLAKAGDEDPKEKGCTSHIGVVDSSGSMVSMTNTLLSSLGSKVVLPGTGFVMNNGVLWFDPRPGQVNSIAGGKRPLTNMCPAIVQRDGRPTIAVGAAGGRRIMAAVGQLIMFVNDFDMDVQDAGHWPRIDVSGPDRVTADRRLSDDVLDALRQAGDTEVVDWSVMPFNFARAGIIENRDGMSASGLSDPYAPWSAALAP